MTLWSWSTDPATNGAADATCPFPEGMAPSQVNDSARGIMAAVAKYRDDISGGLTTAGTSTAYTITSNQVFDTLAHMDGAMIAFVPHTTSGAAPTLNVDGLGAKPLRGQSAEELLSGVLLEGTPYVAFYNNTAAEFVLHSYFVNPGEIPIGSGIEYWGTTAPSTNFVFAYGQAISRTDYATCYARLSTTYGSGDGSTTFNLPDKRGRVSAGKDDMGGSAASRLTSAGAVTGTTLGYGGGSQSHTLTTAQLAQHAHTASTSNSSSTFTLSVGGFKALVDITASTPMTPGGSSVQGQSGLSQTPSVTIPSAALNLSTTVDNAGSSEGHNNVQPTIICNYIIRVK